MWYVPQQRIGGSSGSAARPKSILFMWRALKSVNGTSWALLDPKPYTAGHGFGKACQA